MDLDISPKRQDSFAAVTSGVRKASDSLTVPEISYNLATTAFEATKSQTDHIIIESGFAGYYDTVHAAQIQLCIAFVIENFTKVRCNLIRSKPGDKLKIVHTIPILQKHVEFCCTLLEKAGFICKDESDDDNFWRRTEMPINAEGVVPSSQTVLDDMLKMYPDFASLNNLIGHAGNNLADIWKGRKDAVSTVFGSSEGRDYLGDIYGPAHPSKAFHLLMRDFIIRFMNGLLEKTVGEKLVQLKVLELGGGTGGTAKYLAPLLAEYSERLTVSYTFTDIAHGFVGQAARKFQQHSSFMEYRVQDIEQPPSNDLAGTQHIVIAVNVVHATRNMVRSLTNLRKFLQPHGLALVMEVQEQLCWADFVFGLFEGWWKFDDGRTHATAGADTWKNAFTDAGFIHVDCTGGKMKESGLQRVFLALNAS